MSDAMMDKVEELLHSVSNDITKMHQQHLDDNETFLAALDDVAANVLGLQSIVAALVKTYPIDANAAKAWLKANMDPDGQGTEKADAVVDHLLGIEG
ncbi:conserved hypothetical protein [uncultured Alphaproteobacteria bacterium]|uniref:Uncharacterized protein n=1 Tax=uncultured Alphaproteobacteria bacterium TaxID=91750 RepID=A0A212JPS2_9PROT|nr:conserved hypothetical protein [uncultured Alphaproteobacteria bacterium]